MNGLRQRRAAVREAALNARAEALEKMPVKQDSKPVPNSQFVVEMLDLDPVSKRRNRVTVRAGSQEGLDQIIKAKIAKGWQIAPTE